MYYKITRNAIEYLSKADAKLGDFIRERGEVRRTMFPDALECFVRTIAAQQIAGAAAAKIFERIKNESDGKPDAQKMIFLGEERLRACGLSATKAACILSVSADVAQGRLDFEKLARADEAELSKTLLKIRGVGGWTVEMMSIFAFGKNDVFSAKDFGVRKGFCKLHDIAEISEYKKLYSPFGTAASIYMWELAKD